VGTGTAQVNLMSVRLTCAVSVFFCAREELHIPPVVTMAATMCAMMALAVEEWQLLKVFDKKIH
jgi:hypothetical protein